jgi:hypothetical protein
MTANSAYAICPDRQSERSLSHLDRIWRRQEDNNEGGGEICPSSPQDIRPRPLIHAVNTLRRSPLFEQLASMPVACGAEFELGNFSRANRRMIVFFPC